MAVVGAAISAVGGWFAAGGAGTFFTTTIVGKLLTSVALSALQQALQKRAAKNQRQPGIQTEYTTEGGTRPMSFLLGRYATAGHVICPPMSCGKDGKTPNAFLTYVINLGDVPGQELDQVIINDEIVEFEPDEETIPIGGVIPSGKPEWWYLQQGLGALANTPVPSFTPGRTGTGDYAGKVWLRFHNGRQTTADPFLMHAYGVGTRWDEDSERPWTSDMVGVGTCYAVITFKLDRELWSGLPRCRFVLRGIPLYDPRRDTTAGGTGLQRWDDPLTWAVTNNPMVMCYNIFRGVRIMNGPTWGLDVPAQHLPLAAWVPAMSACDTEVQGKPRWQAGFEVSVDDEPLDVVEELLKVCSGQVAESGGVWKPRVGGPGAPVYFFSDDDIILTEEAVFTPHPGLAATYNGVQASYPEPDELWQPKDAPPRFNAEYEAADQNHRLVADLSLPACPYPNQVQRLMRAYIEEERRFRRHVLVLPPEAAVLEPLDSISWSSEENGYIAKIFEVVEVEEDELTGNVRVTLRERDPSDYDWHPDFELPTTIPSTRVVRDPAMVPEYFTVEGISIDDDAGIARRPAARLRWGGWALEGVSGVRWEIRRGDDVARGMMGDPEEGEMIVSAGMLPATDYEARLSFMPSKGRAVAWTLWRPFRTPDVRLTALDVAFDEIQDQVREDLAVYEEWMGGTGAFIRAIRDEIAALGDGMAEIDYANFTVHGTIRQELVAEVGQARAEYLELINVAVTETEAVATRVTTLAVAVDDNTAAITQEQLARADADSALALNIETVEAATEDNAAAITQEQLARANADSALAADITTVEASLGTKANASTVNALTSRVTTTEGQITAQSDAITQVNAQVGRVSANGLIRMTAQATPAGSQTRVGIHAEASDGATTHVAGIFLDAKSTGHTQVIVRADSFAVVGNLNNNTLSVPFVIQGGIAYFDEAYIRAATIASYHLGDGIINSAKIANVIQSDNFVGGENGSGWRIQKNGTAEFNNVIIRRQIEVASGTVNIGTFDTSQGAFGVGARATIELEKIDWVLSTPVTFASWMGAKKTYLVNVEIVSGTAYGTPATPDDTRYWGWVGEVFPLNIWAGGTQTLRIQLQFWSRNINGMADAVVRWKIYEVS